MPTKLKERPAPPPAAAAEPAPADHPLLEGLNAEQRRAVTHGAGPLLIVAGAGTGKTTVISKRVAWLISTGRAKPEEILALTFTEKAAGEMTDRVDQLLPLGYVDLWISTFHAFCRRILEERGLDIGVPNEFRLLDQTDAYLLVRRHFDKFPLDYYRPLGNPTKFIHGMLRHFSRAKDEDISPEDYLKYAKDLALDADDAEGIDRKRQQELADAYHVYQKLLLDEGCLDLGDLQMYAIRLLRTRPQLLADYRKRFKYVLVDEFQDTNWAQYELIKMLSGKDGNLVVVGDDDQSIYKFRGASVSNILQFKNDFPSAKDIVLTTNYRSRQGILDRSYAFIQKNNPNRLEVKLAGADGKGITKRLTGERPGEATVEHLRFTTHDEEVAGVVNRIVDMKEADPEREWSDFAILVRSNSAADDYSRRLQRRGVPYQFLALRGLYTKPVIMDCLAYFALLDDYHESPAFYRVLSSPPYAVPGGDLVALAHEARKTSHSIYEVASGRNALAWLSDEARGKLDKLMGDIARHTQLARTKGVTQLLIAFLTESGYLKHLKSGDDASAREQFSYLHQFLDRLKRFEETHDEPTLRSFIAEFALERESGEEGSLAFDPETGPDMVRIMTVHAAKGLEFPYVFIVDLVDKRFPSVARAEEIPLPDALTKEILPDGGDVHLEEERRLFYVAMTRAKDGLFLTSAEDYGGKTKKKPSRFLAELGFGDAPSLAPAGERLEEPAPVPAPTGPIVLPTPERFSFSAMAAYDNCPLQYKYAHVIRIPSLGKATQSFGNTMHATLEWFLTELSERDAAPQATLFGDGNPEKKAGLTVSRDELLKKYEECWLDDWYESKDEKERFRAEGREMLAIFYDRCVATPPKPLFLEKEFSLKIGEHTLKGTIDRIDGTEGGVEIIDYKTGKPKTEDDLDADAKRQLLLYQIAVGRLFGLVPVKLTYHYLKDGTTVSFLGTEKQLAKLEGDAEATFAKIKAGEYAPTPGRHCKFCDFREICEFRAA
ncbi:MAG TPA: ATP-dependent DNA helicase [Candidatus Binatia bacterium]|nr:ATP-dependent DNA helicase [Candidatus Binatia bacterium]